MARKKHHFYFSDTQIKERFEKYGKQYFPEFVSAGLIASDEDIAAVRKLIGKGESLFEAILEIMRCKAEILAERNQNID